LSEMHASSVKHMECLRACTEAQRVCVATADACLAEPEIGSLRRCIALGLACATVCDATASLLAQATQLVPELLRAQLQSCVQACNLCGTECEMHAASLEYCRICRHACRTCEDVCRETIGHLVKH
jgi:hypothetical protein